MSKWSDINIREIWPIRCACISVSHTLLCAGSKVIQIPFTVEGRNLGQLKLCHSASVSSTVVRISWLVCEGTQAR